MAINPIKHQLKQHLEDILPALWLEGFGDVEVELDDNPALKGATDALFYEIVAKINFVIKFGLIDVPNEQRGYKILSQASSALKKHLVPLIGEGKKIYDLGLNKAILLTPYINSLTLHQIVSQEIADKKWILDLYGNILNELKNLWRKTRNSKKPSLEDIYIRRLHSRLTEFKKKFKINRQSKIKLIINDKKFNIEGEIIPAIQKKIIKLKNRVKYSCVVHGDEHAKNILVKEDSVGLDKQSWVLIDCGNARLEGDWIFSIAKILHWWKVYFALENAKQKQNLKGVFKIDKNLIKIEYNVKSFKKRFPKICDDLYSETLKFCRIANKEIFKEKDSVWQERLKIALFINLFGAITRHSDYKSKFALPFLIGESVKFLKEL